MLPSKNAIPNVVRGKPVFRIKALLVCCLWSGVLIVLGAHFTLLWWQGVVGNAAAGVLYMRSSPFRIFYNVVAVGFAFILFTKPSAYLNELISGMVVGMAIGYVANVYLHWHIFGAKLSEIAVRDGWLSLLVWLAPRVDSFQHSVFLARLAMYAISYGQPRTLGFVLSHQNYPLDDAKLNASLLSLARGDDAITAMLLAPARRSSLTA